MPRLSDSRLYSADVISPYSRQIWRTSNTAGTSPYGVVMDAQGDFADHLMRNVSGGPNVAVPTDIHKKAQALGVYLFQVNPLASRQTELIRDYTVGGEGIRYEAEDSRVQKLLDRFWNDDSNRWSERILEFSQDLSIYGEQLLTFATDERTGLLLVQDVNPMSIDHVITTTYAPKYF